MIYFIMIGIWTALFIATLVIEIFTADLTTIWFCVASLITLIVAAFGVDYPIQIGVYALTTAVLLVATRPLTKKMMQQEIIHTNADRVIDMVGIVTSIIVSDGIGEVKVDNSLWRAVSRERECIEEGSKVTVTAISGNKLIVTKVNDINKVSQTEII